MQVHVLHFGRAFQLDDVPLVSAHRVQNVSPRVRALVIERGLEHGAAKLQGCEVGPGALEIQGRLTLGLVFRINDLLCLFFALGAKAGALSSYGVDAVEFSRLAALVRTPRDFAEML